MVPSKGYANGVLREIRLAERPCHLDPKILYKEFPIVTPQTRSCLPELSVEKLLNGVSGRIFVMWRSFLLEKTPPVRRFLHRGKRLGNDFFGLKNATSAAIVEVACTFAQHLKKAVRI